ncbi:MAG: peptidoglycan DD-metalloendopeptidase family protein [Porticoccus sp.]|nr:peptidoglycan DD-metalloendopeptidase family protein [Porticoccus sp.]MBQ0807720.1 peptidoglycan DD-metalloendopeptidase family protein [Porticoccus sp.]
MNIIFISNREGKSLSLTLNNWAKVLLSVCLLGLPVCSGLYLGMQFSGDKVNLLGSIEIMKQELAQQQAELEAGREAARQTVEALTLKLAAMQARLVRLDALGERLTDMASLDDGEFDFSQQPSLGGPEQEWTSTYQHSDLEKLYAQLQSQLESRESQLGILESLMVDRKIKQQSAVTGRPIKKGWMSSVFGYRTDPFKGHRAWHNGVDFAGKDGSDIVAVASGVVTWSGDKNGYGQVLELDHGEGHITRYAHNKKNLVNVGDTVKKGEVIGLMGSSGRSTGPHVHFEVYKNGRAVDPASYIRRTIR